MRGIVGKGGTKLTIQFLFSYYDIPISALI